MRSPRLCPRRWAPAPPLREDMQTARASASPADSGATGDGGLLGPASQADRSLRGGDSQSLSSGTSEHSLLSLQLL